MLNKYTALAAAGLFILSACSQEETTAPAPSSDSAEAPGPNTGPTAQAKAALDPKAQFSACAVCHTVKEGDRAMVGPNLFGIVGRIAASNEDFAYSKAMRESGIVWNEENLDAFIANPQQFMRGNRMAFVGERNTEKRAAIIEYLKSLE